MSSSRPFQVYVQICHRPIQLFKRETKMVFYSFEMKGRKFKYYEDNYACTSIHVSNRSRLRGFSGRHHPIQRLKGGTIMALKNEIRTKVQEQWKRLIKAYTTFKMLEGHTRGDKLCMSNSRPFQVERVLESSSSNPNA